MKRIAVAALLLFAIFPLFAREVWILVEDAELGLPLEGAVIRSWDGKQYECGNDGKAVITAPDDRQVVVQAAYPGYENGRLVITANNSAFTIGLRLSGVMEGRELVIEAQRPGTSETKTGRSVAVSGREITQTAEIGIIEDVMSSIKLLPGVGYAGIFNAQPSIRGGFPGDMNASLDGYYVMNPYHWGGGFSIFDPRMVQSAQLSHGVFSARYGHTISGLLDITSTPPNPSETEFEIGYSTSAANINLSFPFAGKGGVLFMGRITYYDPVVRAAQALGNIGLYSKEQVDALNAIRQAPYIRSMTITGNYRFADNLELHSTGFWGMDGIGVTYRNESQGSGGISNSSRLALDWTNYQGFITTALKWNPRNDMLLKFTLGTGYEDAVVDMESENSVQKDRFSDDFFIKYPELKTAAGLRPSPYYTHDFMNQSNFMFNIQARTDYDWELGNGFLAAAGAQEMFTRYAMEGDQQGSSEIRYRNLGEGDKNKIESLFGPYLWGQLSDQFRNDLRISYPAAFSPNSDNFLLTTSGYSLVEYVTPNKKFGAELGLRLDHYYLSGDGFSYGTKPALNPRLNLDYNVFKNLWIIESLDLSAGTGFFSTMDNAVFMAEEQFDISEIKPNRAWTSVLGTKITLPEGMTFNIEGYYKFVFDRMYIPITRNLDDIDVRPQFDGEGRIWGIDMMLQKLQSRYADGWISYSFSWARYRDPSSGNANMGISGGTRGNDWYFPNFHRFHNLNLVVNIKPAPRFNLYTRFGFASGTQISRRVAEGPTTYPVIIYDASGKLNIVQRYYWPSVSDENNRSSPTLSMDMKFSYFGKNPTGKVRCEYYFAVENLLSLVYSPQGNTRYNSYTGEVDTGSDAANYGIPVPIPSFGVKFSY